MKTKLMEHRYVFPNERLKVRDQVRILNLDHRHDQWMEVGAHVVGQTLDTNHQNLFRRSIDEN